jgi:adenylylsulfate kinase-like enzyme
LAPIGSSGSSSIRRSKLANNTKGLYAEARRGTRRNVTGIVDPYEAPMAPD